MKNFSFCFAAFFALSVLSITSCRDDSDPREPVSITAVTGYYLLNEGKYEGNNASLDFYDAQAGVYTKGIFAAVNPEVTLGLGDTGNDLKIYGSKLYAVINVSGKIEVMNVHTGKRIKMIEIPGCRSVAFAGGKAYVCTWNGNDPESPAGQVVEIDTATLSVTRRVQVGRQPERMAVLGNTLWVSNSGGTSGFDNTLSRIDLTALTETGRSEVAVNPGEVLADAEGKLWVSSGGDYTPANPAALYCFDPQAGSVVKQFDLAVGTMALSGDTLLVISKTYDENWQATYDGHRIDVRTTTLLPGHFISDGTTAEWINPYKMAVNPVSREILITEAVDYFNNGKLYVYSAAGKRSAVHATGVAPASIAFCLETTWKE